MTVPAYLDHLSVALGDRRSSVEESALTGMLCSSPAALREAGFAHHYVCLPATSAYELARRVVEPLRDVCSNVDAIVYATTLPRNANVGDEARFLETRDVKFLMDFPVSRLQAELGLGNAVLFGLTQQACTGFLGAIRFAHCLLAGEPSIHRILCLTADRFPDGARYEQAYNLISDGAAACIVQREPARSGFRILGNHAISNGALSFATDDETMGAFFTYTHRLVRETLARAQLALNDVRWIVTQNTNIAAWRVLASILGIDWERVCCPTLDAAGHMISGDNVMNLRHLLADGGIQRGDKALLVMAGYGLSWQSLVLEKE